MNNVEKIAAEIDQAISTLMAEVDRLTKAREFLVPPEPTKAKAKPKRRARQQATKTRMPTAEREAQVRAVLVDRKTLDTSEVAQLLGVHQSYAGNLLRGMAGKDTVVKLSEGNGRHPATWSLPELLDEIRPSGSNGSRDYEPALS